MDSISIIEVPNLAGDIIEHVIIDHGDGSFTSMPKAVWDEQQAQMNRTGVVTNGDN